MKWQFLPHGKHCVSVTKTDWLMLFRGNKHFFFFSESYTESAYTLYEKDA